MKGLNITESIYRCYKITLLANNCSVEGSNICQEIKLTHSFQKLREKFAKDPEKFKTLQDIVESEIAENTTDAKNSATDALLWLKRLVSSIGYQLQNSPYSLIHFVLVSREESSFS